MKKIRNLILLLIIFISFSAELHSYPISSPTTGNIALQVGKVALTVPLTLGVGKMWKDMNVSKRDFAIGAILIFLAGMGCCRDVGGLISMMKGTS